MAKVEVIVCDKCSSRKGPHVHLEHAILSYTDAAGATDHHYVLVDLCYECAFSQLKTLVQAMQYQDRIAFYKRLGVEVRSHRGEAL